MKFTLSQYPAEAQSATVRRLTVAGGTIYAGSATVSFTRALAYTSFNLPSTITQVQGAANYSYTYTYNAEHERVKLITARPDDTLTSIYLHRAGKGSLLYEKEIRWSDGRVEHKHYVNGGSGPVGVYVTYSAGTSPGMRYYHRDHLGSVAAISNEAGAVLERHSYEAFGERRNADGSPQDRSSPVLGVTTDRGFTGHEHLDELNLVHMNGRIFDPALGRFMTADPFVQDPNNLQSYGRYSYGFNNPLVGTDPTGYFWGWVVAAVAEVAHQVGIIDKQTARQIQGIAIAFELGPTAGSGAATWANVGQAAGAGFAGGFVGSDFSVQGGVNGAFSALLFYGAGSATDAGGWGRVAAHAGAGCVGAAAGGGSCGSGALSAGFTEAALGGRGFSSREAGLVAHAVVGGTASVLGGGKFSNGAVTGSFGYLFNQRAHGSGSGVRDRSVYAADFGQVSDVGWENPNNEKQGFGFRIYVRLIDGNVDIYGHMDPGVMVSRGEPVAQGQYLGQYADPANGTATGPHLHFERRDPMGNRIDTGQLNVVGSGGRATSFFGPRTIRGKKGYHYGYDYIGPIIP